MNYHQIKKMIILLKLIETVISIKFNKPIKFSVPKKLRKIKFLIRCIS